MNEGTHTIDDCLCDECVRVIFRLSQPQFNSQHCATEALDPSNECTCRLIAAARTLTDGEMAQYQADFSSVGLVSVPNFLQPSWLDLLSTAVHGFKHTGVWHASFWNEEGGSSYCVQHTTANRDILRNWIEKQHVARSKNEYSYSFTRTVHERVPYLLYRAYPLLFEHMENMMQSDQIRAILRNITGKDFRLSEIFLSRYTTGDLYALK